MFINKLLINLDEGCEEGLLIVGDWLRVWLFVFLLDVFKNK